MPKIIALAGGIGSGKSTVARAVADHLGCSVASFGDYVRLVLKADGQTPSRENLQRMSENLIHSLGWQGLTHAVLAGIQWSKAQSLVVDGVRHPDVIRALKAATAPVPVSLVYLDVSPQVRATRVAARDKVSSRELAEFDRHPTEISVGTDVKAMADLTVNADGIAEQIVAAIVRAIS